MIPINQERIVVSILFFFFFFFAFSRAPPVPYGRSQARGQIRAVTNGLLHGHSNAGSEPHLRAITHSQQSQILNPLRKARDRTLNLMVPSQIP